jgi:glycine cleavage system transcriptional repressor
MSHWYMLTLVGEDRPGIVARVTAALFEGGCNLGEAAMVRLGGNFTIMLMVQFEGEERDLTDLLETVVDSLGLRMHLDLIEGHLHQHLLPDVCVRVFGADRSGIVAQVTGALAEAGLNILDLESDVGGTKEKPVYIMTIEGQANEGINALRSALEVVADEENIDVEISPIDTMIG